MSRSAEPSEAVWRLSATTEADPGVLVRVLQFLQLRNVVPRRVLVQHTYAHDEAAEVLRIEIEVRACDLTREALVRVAAKIGELPAVLTVLLDE